MSPRPLHPGKTYITSSELRESCCAMRVATEKMARIHGLSAPVCPRKQKCQEQARRSAA